MAGLTPLDDARRLNSPPLQGRGRGWGLSAGRLAVLQDRAAAMRTNPTAPEARLWRALSRSQLGTKFRRQAVLGEWIVDFLSPTARLIVEVDGETHDPERDRVRDAGLASRGYRVLRVTNRDVMTNIDGVKAVIRSAIVASAATPHPNPSPGGEGLSGFHLTDIAC